LSLFKLPTVSGVIQRRMLINYRLDLAVAKKILPKPFEPLEYAGSAMVGICLIRLVKMKPSWAPQWLGTSSENAAHRFAVNWSEDSQNKQGVYIPRRDTSSLFSSFAGGRIFPGKQHLSKFVTHEDGQNFELSFYNSDTTQLSVKAQRASSLSPDSIFSDLQAASDFYQMGSLGHSPLNRGTFQAVKLNTSRWSVSPLKVHFVQSSYFENTSLFPSGSIIFDNALLMENIEHSWESKSSLILK